MDLIKLISDHDFSGGNAIGLSLLIRKYNYIVHAHNKARASLIHIHEFLEKK